MALTDVRGNECLHERENRMGITMIVMSTRLKFLFRSLGFIGCCIGESRLASFPGGISIASCGWTFVTINPRFYLATVVGAIVYSDDFATVFTANTIEKVRLVSGIMFPRRKHTESHVSRQGWIPKLWAHFFTVFATKPQTPGNYCLHSLSPWQTSMHFPFVFFLFCCVKCFMRWEFIASKTYY